MPEQQHTSDQPFCQTAIPRGQSRGIFIRILSVDRPLYWSLSPPPPGNYYYLEILFLCLLVFISVIITNINLWEFSGGGGGGRGWGGGRKGGRGGGKVEDVVFWTLLNY